MSKGYVVILSALFGLVLYGVVFDWFQEPAQITPAEIEVAERMCSPAQGLKSVGKKGGMRKALTDPASPVLAVCINGSTVKLASPSSK